VDTSRERKFHRKKKFHIPVIAGLFLAGAAGAGGFDFQLQGAKAMAMAGAFVAQADDPSAIFYILGGMPFTEKKFAAGVSAFFVNEALYQGLAPGPGAGTAAAQDDPQALLPHVYTVKSLGERWRLGVGIVSPFYLETEWRDPGAFAGRTASVASQIVTYDLDVELAVSLGPRLGLGFGAAYRLSQLSWSRRLLLGGRDVAQNDVETDTVGGLGWNVGVLHRPSPKFSWGLAYHSDIRIDHDGVGRLTQIETGDAQIDELVRNLYPFDQDVLATTELSYPASASLGLALRPSPRWLVEVDLQWTEWSRFQEVSVAFPTEPSLAAAVPERFDDTVTPRLGLEFSTRTGTSFRLGVAFEASPQPDATVGPFLADADSLVYTVGLGRDWLDVAFAWIDRGQRNIVGQVDNLNGNYRSSAWVVCLTVSKRSLAKALKGKVPEPPKPPQLPGS